MSNEEIIEEKLWMPLKEEEKDAEAIVRPSLTFLEDGWRRLKANKIAMGSMIIIIIIILGAIFIPMFWKYSYEQQNLYMANIPFRIPTYSIDDESSIYVTPEFTVVELTKDGHLIELMEPTRRDIIEKKNFYEYQGKSLIIDYSIYNKALLEYKKINEKLQGTDINTVEISKVPYLSEYFSVNPDKKEVTLEEAKSILDTKVSKMNVIYDNQILEKSRKVWNKTYILGTDNLGRDLFIRLVYGARISLTVGIFAAMINLVVGVLYGGIAGYMGGRIDNIMMRFVDIIGSIPMTLYVILIMVIVGPGFSSIILALGLTFWVRMARIVRGQVLTLKQQEFVKAAIVTGQNTKGILIKHLIPNMMGPIMVSIAMQIPSAIFNEAFLSFIGLGVSAPQASWGTLANDALAGIYVYPYQMFLPAVAISVTILSFNLFSDGLRDSFDPKLRK